MKDEFGCSSCKMRGTGIVEILEDGGVTLPTLRAKVELSLRGASGPPRW
jgi:hypothetical protein